MATKQETFDTVVAHLRKQGVRSENIEGCLYRGPNGLKCAAGCLIPDNLYKEYFEFNLADCDLLEAVWLQLGHDTKLVRRLQQVHDDGKIEDWEKGFKEVADLFELEYKVTYETA